MALDLEFRPELAEFTLLLQTPQARIPEIVEWSQENLNFRWNYTQPGPLTYFPHYDVVLHFWFEEVKDAIFFKLKFGNFA